MASVQRSCGIDLVLRRLGIRCRRTIPLPGAGSAGEDGCGVRLSYGPSTSRAVRGALRLVGPSCSVFFRSRWNLARCQELVWRGDALILFFDEGGCRRRRNSRSDAGEGLVRTPMRSKPEGWSSVGVCVLGKFSEACGAFSLTLGLTTFLGGILPDVADVGVDRRRCGSARGALFSVPSIACSRAWRRSNNFDEACFVEVAEGSR